MVEDSEGEKYLDVLTVFMGKKPQMQKVIMFKSTQGQMFTWTDIIVVFC